MIGRLRVPSGVFASAAALASAGAIGGVVYRSLVRGSLTIDLNLGRRRRELGPLRLTIAAPVETVFDVIAMPYLHRVPRAMDSKLQVIARGSDYALAAHFTPVNAKIAARTIELVQFERPERITFRLLRGPVADGFETFELHADGDETAFEYRGHLEADLWAVGAWWLGAVGRRWEAAVQATLDSVRQEAERRVIARRR